MEKWGTVHRNQLLSLKFSLGSNHFFSFFNIELKVLFSIFLAIEFHVTLLSQQENNVSALQSPPLTYTVKYMLKNTYFTYSIFIYLFNTHDLDLYTCSMSSIWVLDLKVFQWNMFINVLKNTRLRKRDQFARAVFVSIWGGGWVDQ